MVMPPNMGQSGSVKKHYAFVMMVREKYWIAYLDRHQEGENVHAYVTKGAAPPRNTRFLLFYVSKPVKSLCGYASFIERELGDLAELWNKYSAESVLKSKAEYEGFVGTAGSVSFVRFTDLYVAVSPVSLRNILLFLGVKRLSRKGFYLGKDVADQLISMMQ
jgi:predicted transcriptional regulator